MSLSAPGMEKSAAQAAAAGGEDSQPVLSLFFPCYNDAGTIASLVALADLTARGLTDRYEVIVIDDGSSDHSRAILKSLEPRYPRLRLIFHEKNRGYGGALRSGFAAAVISCHSHLPSSMAQTISKSGRRGTKVPGHGCHLIRRKRGTGS